MGAPGTDLRGWRWLAGRASRAEFWLWAVVLTGWTWLLAFSPANIVHLIAPWAFFFQVIRRLHDIDHSGWWAAGLLPAQIVVYAALSVYPGPAYAGILTGGLLVATLAIVGLIPGSPRANRFGPPPATFGRRAKETFG